MSPVSLVLLLALGCPKSDAPVPVAAPASSAIAPAPELLIEDLVIGDGEELTEATRKVRVHYTGWLADGTKFDSSVDRGVAFRYLANSGRVIQGWETGVRGMRVGGKRKLTIPPEQGYGDVTRGPIPGGSTLIFEIELLSMAAERVIPDGPTPLVETDFMVTDTGLKWADLKPCSGEYPSPGDRVTAEYTGWLMDGTMFDSSYKRDQGIVFPASGGRVIKGWDEAILTMSEGCSRQIVVPPELGYGERGAGGLIPPGATLRFEIELVDIER